MIRIRTLWIMTGLWIVGDVIFFLIGWADLRDVISGNVHLLSFTVAVHLVTLILGKGD